MRLDLNVYLSNIEFAEATWTKSSPDFPSQENLNGTGISVSDVSHSIVEVYGLMRVLEDVDFIGVDWFYLIRDMRRTGSGLTFYMKDGVRPYILQG